MPQLKRICVDCGSSRGLLPEYCQAARTLGRTVAQEGIELVFGGADCGLMGEVADSALAHGGRVLGVMPKWIADRVGHRGLTETFIVSTMHERKQKMFDLADGFIALPGGMGTLEEIFEVLTWGQLGMHAKPCGLLNVAGYYDHLLRFLDHCVEQRFIKPVHRGILLVASDAAELLAAMRAFQSPVASKW